MMECRWQASELIHEKMSDTRDELVVYYINFVFELLTSTLPSGDKDYFLMEPASMPPN